LSSHVKYHPMGNVADAVDGTVRVDMATGGLRDVDEKSTIDRARGTGSMMVVRGLDLRELVMAGGAIVMMRERLEITEKANLELMTKGDREETGRGILENLKTKIISTVDLAHLPTVTSIDQVPVVLLDMKLNRAREASLLILKITSMMTQWTVLSDEDAMYYIDNRYGAWPTNDLEPNY
jgi:hypothetical protein